MRQGMRLLTKPATFFNQLQWSTHHWIILVAFLGLATIETQVGRNQALYQAWALLLERRLGLSLDAALWVVTAFRLAILIAGSVAVSTVIWFVGHLFGRRTSKRVLFRRLAVVFTVLLAGYTASHLTGAYPALAFVSLVMYLWGLVLGYFAIREQFALNHLETVVVGLFALLLVSSSWHFSNHVIEKAARGQVAVKATPGPVVPRF